MDENFFKELNLPIELRKKLILKEAKKVENEKNSFSIKLQSNVLLDPEEILTIIEKIKEISIINIRLHNLLVYQPNVDSITSSEIYGYLYLILKKLDSSILMSSIIVEKVNNDFYLYYANKSIHEKLEVHKKLIEKILKNFSLLIGNLFFVWDDTKFNLNTLRKINSEKEMQVLSPALKNFDKQPQAGFKLINPKKLVDDIDKAYFDGRVFKIDIRDTKNKKVFVKYGIVNNQTAIYANLFIENSNFIPKIANDNWVRFYGKVKFNSYSKSYEMNMTNFEMLSKNKGLDYLVCDEPRKRPELHIHTQMSQMDGVGSVESYFEAARHYKMPAIAFTDTNVLQAYPEISRISKNYPEIKKIYGVEFDVYDDINVEIVTNSRDEGIKDAEYVFFDLETTGLSAESDEIIEIGAIKVRNGNVIGKLETFIKPKNPIPAFITKITSIRNEDVQSAPSLSETINKIREFFDNAILVAHNSDFDIAFINKAYRDNGFDEVKNPVLDSLKLSWLLNPTLKNHRLGTLARHVGVIYDDLVAHRAQYDSEILHKVYENHIHKLYEKGIKSLIDFNSHIFDIRNNIISNTVTVLAKNQKGLKKLFYLTSEAHTSYFNKIREKASLPLSKLLSEREDLLIGSGGQRSQLWDALNSSSSKLEKFVNYFDYIELFHIETFDNLIKSNRTTKEQIKKNFLKLHSVAKKLNKKVITNSDCFYALPENKIARDVYVSNKGIGGKPHYLFDYQNPAQPSPNQHLRTTTEMLKSFSTIFSKQIVEEIVFTDPLLIVGEIESNITSIKEGLYSPKIKNSKEELLLVVENTSKRIYGENIHQEIKSRIDKELKSIIDHNFYVIYYLSYKITKKSLDEGYLVGSRGSVGSSIIATLANITEVNPLKPHYICKSCKYHEFNTSVDDGYDLPDKLCPKCNEKMYGEGHDIPFETFLGFEGNKVPDIDLNFAGDKQASIHDFVKELIGENNVFRAGTISTTQNRTAFGYVKNYLEVTNTLNDFNQAEIDYICSLVVGTKRTTGQHPGGIIIVPNDMDIYDFTPINFPGNDTSLGWKTTHFDFHSIHDNLLKLDILGHVDPSVLKMLGEITGIDPKDIPMNLPEVVSIFASNKELKFIHKFIDEPTGAVGLPEFGTQFVREMLNDTKPKTFADLIRISGLSHGTNVWTDNAKTLIKEGVATLEEVISVRDGIMNYLIKKGIEPKTSFAITESVRKGLGVAPEYVKIMLDNKVPEWYIESCKKIKYMFPKAHATAYVIMAYRIAWYKINYPLEFYATFFSKRDVSFDIDSLFFGPTEIKNYIERIKNLGPNEIKEKDNLVLQTYEIVLEMYSRGYQIIPISLERSTASEWIIDKKNNALIPPFDILDSLGETLAKKLVLERAKRPFSSYDDFVKRTNLNKNLLDKMKNLNILTDLSSNAVKEQSIFDFIK